MDLDKKKLKNKEWRENNKERIKARMKLWHAANRDRATSRIKNLRTERRVAVLAEYGGKCICCGEKHEAFLQIDHIHNDGAHERRLSSTVSRDMYLHIIKQNFPKDKYQILCANCNWAKARLGKCPHKQSPILSHR